MSNNPFSEPDDPDRTVIRPMPGGARGAPRAARPAAPPPDAPAERAPPAPSAPPPVLPGADLAEVATAQNPLAGAAAPLLQLLARLRAAATPPDQGDMRDRTIREVREFERRAREAGVPMEQLRPAHYALCASLDDAVLNTPWGATGRWSARPLITTFHQEPAGGDGFFDQLRTLRTDPAGALPVLELMYLCMSLGFMGPFRAMPDGVARMDRIREQTFALIAGQRPAVAGLSPQWRGVDVPYRVRRTIFPVWVAVCIALAVVAGTFVWAMNGLNAGSDALYAQMQQAAPNAMPALVRAPVRLPLPPPPEPPPPGPADRLRAALASDVAERAVTVLGTPSATVLRIPAAKLFPQANAALGPGAAPLLDRIGQALKAERGTIRVVGYTDNQPVKAPVGASLFKVSEARAQAVRAALLKPVGEAGRLSAEGRADADPVGPNATADGRELNRRIEIVMQRQD